jgi:hypothetical protein
MLGRVLFTVVCVIIATGALLPVYPADVSLPAVAGARHMLLADNAALGTAGCATKAGGVADGPDGSCGCDHLLAATKACVHLTVYVIVGRLPASGHAFELSRPLPELPNI